MGVGDQRHVSAVVPTGKRPGTLVMEGGWAPGPVWTGMENIKSLSSTGVRTP